MMRSLLSKVAQFIVMDEEMFLVESLSDEYRQTTLAAKSNRFTRSPDGLDHASHV